MRAASRGGPARNDLILVHVTNTGREPPTLQPSLIVDTKLGMQKERQHIVVNSREWVTSSLKMAGTAHGSRVPLEPLTVPLGKTVDFFVLYSTGDAIVLEPTTVAGALACREQAVEFWQQKAGVPFGRIEVPDAGIQALVDSAIRNIWQAREIKKRPGSNRSGRSWHASPITSSIFARKP